jgi:hypothetical protein
LQKFAPFPSALFTILVHSELSPTLACVPQQEYQCHWVLYVLVALQCLLLGIYSWWHDTENSMMPVAVPSFSRIQVVGHLPTWCTLKFTACLFVSLAQRTLVARWQISPNGSQPWTTMKSEVCKKPLCPTHVLFKSLNPIQTWCWSLILNWCLLLMSCQTLLITTLHGPKENTIFYYPECVFTGPLPSNECSSIVERLCCRNVFTDPLPSNEYTRHNTLLDHIFPSWWISNGGL